ncbi:hypothetical protein ACPOLB_27330 (plasmid) [Rubrivivax sp. RP6-9]|uniref:hypothetical protein n=1 Tax=Rubrivivax sp. RP6-9 TaxID=3415750 RepID=UPI003CC57521
MLVWDDREGALNIFAMNGVSANRDARSVYESYLCSLNRIILRDGERFDFLPNKLSAAMIGALKAMCGCAVVAVETRYAQWQQYVVCATLAVAKRSREVSAQHLSVSTVRPLRRAKAFFVSQKVNGRNAP